MVPDPQLLDQCQNQWLLAVEGEQYYSFKKVDGVISQGEQDENQTNIQRQTNPCAPNETGSQPGWCRYRPVNQ
jgi:hypothetical protein